MVDFKSRASFPTVKNNVSEGKILCSYKQMHQHHIIEVSQQNAHLLVKSIWDSGVSCRVSKSG